MALKYASQAYGQYPTNTLFIFDQAEMLFRNKKVAESRVYFDQFFNKCSSLKKGCPQKYEYLANYFMAWGYMDENKFDEAKPFVKKADELDTKRYKDRSSDIDQWKKKLKL